MSQPLQWIFWIWAVDLAQVSNFHLCAPLHPFHTRCCFVSDSKINVRKCGTEVKHEEMTHPSNSKASRLDPVRSAQFRVYNLRLLKPLLNLSADVATLAASMRLEIANADSQAWSEVSNHWSTCKAAVSQNVYWPIISRFLALDTFGVCGASKHGALGTGIPEGQAHDGFLHLNTLCKRPCKPRSNSFSCSVWREEHKQHPGSCEGWI